MKAIRWNIYTLENPIDSTIFYVGKTTDIKTRYSTHISAKGSKDKSYIAILKLIIDAGHLPIIRVVEQTYCRAESSKLESKWINYYKAINPLLCNKHLCRTFREFKPGYRQKKDDNPYCSFNAERNLYIQLNRSKEMVKEVSKISGYSQSKVLTAILSNYYNFGIHDAIKKHLNIK